MRKNFKKDVDDVKSYLKVIEFKRFEVCKVGKLLYPRIIVVREDKKDWVFTEADFQNVELSVFHRLVYMLRNDPIRPLELTLTLEACVRYLQSSINLSHFYDFQLALEGWTPKMNTQKPSRVLFKHQKDFPVFTIFLDEDNDTINCVYPDSNGEKKRMILHEVARFCDGTLRIVLKGLNHRLHLHKMIFTLLNERELYMITDFVKTINERIEMRNDIRFAEIKFKLRRKFSKNLADVFPF